MTEINQKRENWLDYIKILGALAVIAIHICSGSINFVDMCGTDWHILNFYQCILRWVIPVFFMASGAVFLGRDISIKKIYSKYILKMVIAYLVWGVVYAIYSVSGGNLWDYIKAILEGYFHMWYILAIIGIYMSVPLLRPIAKDSEKLKYFIILYSVFTIGLPGINVMLWDFGSSSISDILGTFISPILDAKPMMVMGYVGYFMLGYYIATTDFNKKSRRIIYAVGVIGAALTVILNVWQALIYRENSPHYVEPYTINMLMMTFGLFVFAKYNFNFGEKLNNIAGKLVKYTFGIYLIHALMLEATFYKIGITTFSFGNVALAVPVLSFVVFVMSLIIVFVLSKIPVVGKYLV